MYIKNQKKNWNLISKCVEQSLCPWLCGTCTVCSPLCEGFCQINFLNTETYSTDFHLEPVLQLCSPTFRNVHRKSVIIILMQWLYTFKDSLLCIVYYFHTRTQSQLPWVIDWWTMCHYLRLYGSWLKPWTSSCNEIYQLWVTICGYSCVILQLTNAPGWLSHSETIFNVSFMWPYLEK